MNIDYQKLVKPEYIGSREGSSLGELKKAAEDHGTYSVPAGKLTIRDLKSMPYPMILHVKKSAGKKEYNHYELFLGAKEGKALLFDPPEPARLVPFRELSPRWDGNGLVISAMPIDTGAIFASSRKRFALYAAIAVGVILILHCGRWKIFPQAISRSKHFGLSLAQGVGLCCLACLAGLVYHFANDAGFLAHAEATAPIIEAHRGNFIPKVSKKEVAKLLKANTVFIDARLDRDFEAEHLEDAINIPVNSSDEQRKKAMAGISKDDRIVVYCQSAGCKYAEIISIKLIADGFTDVSLFKGGWREWAENKTG